MMSGFGTQMRVSFSNLTSGLRCHPSDMD